MNRFPIVSLLSIAILSFSQVLLAEESDSSSEKTDFATQWTQPTFWETTQQDFLEANQQARFVDDGAGLLRSYTKDSAFFSFPVYESSVRFVEGVPAEATVYLHNRGDAGNLKREDFEAQIEKIKTALTQQFGVEAKAANAASTATFGGFTWEMPATQASLEWSFTREMKSRNIPFRAEFIRLRLEPIKENTTAEKIAEKPIDRKPVKRENGDIVLEHIPMVDQGQKGYCAVATSERVMRYYGRDMDQHELAQIASTSAAEGTSTDAIQRALKKITSRLKVRFRSHYEMDMNGLQTLIRNYNTEARKAKAEQIDLTKFGDYLTLYKSFDPQVFVEARERDKSGQRRFLNEIKKDIDAGIPPLWSLILGVVPEEKINPQTAGGHMRLIIGYNEKNNEILYSDSWGAGHEEKRMESKNAWAVTTGLYTLEAF